MSAILAGLVGLVAREIIQYIGGLIQSYLKKQAETAASDAAIDAHAKATTTEMENTHDPAKMDGADSDILSGR